MTILRRIGGAGVNIGVLVISIAVFFIALFAVIGIANSQKPNTMEILAAAHDLNVGDRLTSNDFVVKTVFVDDNTSMFIEANENEIASTLNGIVVIPKLGRTNPKICFGNELSLVDVLFSQVS